MVWNRTQEIDFYFTTQDPNSYSNGISCWLECKTDKATIGWNLPRKQNALSHEVHSFDEEGETRKLRVILNKTTKRLWLVKKFEKPVPVEYTYTVSVRNDSKNEKSFNLLKADGRKKS